MVLPHCCPSCTAREAVLKDWLLFGTGCSVTPSAPSWLPLQGMGVTPPSGQSILQVPVLAEFSIQAALLHLSMIDSGVSFPSLFPHTRLQPHQQALCYPHQSSDRSGPFSSTQVLSVSLEGTGKKHASLGQQLHQGSWIKPYRESPLGHAVLTDTTTWSAEPSFPAALPWQRPLTPHPVPRRVRMGCHTCRGTRAPRPPNSKQSAAASG